jgi:hypothetical protein
MKRIKSAFMAPVLIVILGTGAAWGQTARWTEQKANAWYAQQPWLVGSNYVPKSAINQLEMWQEASFDPAQIETEFTWAEAMGMNTMRVFLHDLLWQQDAAGFQKRIDRFLTIAARHHIRPMFVLFDSCWDPLPHLGPQLRLGAESGSDNTCRRKPISPPKSIRAGRSRSVRQG